MLSIFIPQDTLEDIVIDNMASDMEPEDQDVWYKIFTKQKVIYVSSLEEKEYIPEDDPLFQLSDSYGVEISYETQYIEGIPDNHESVTKYWNGVFLLNITQEEASEIQRDYGVICQSIKNMDASVLMDPDLRFSPKKKEKGYSWYFMMDKINAEHIPSNHLILIDRYLFADINELEMTLDNVFEILDAMLPHHMLKSPYKVTLIVGEQENGTGVAPSKAAQEVYNMIPDLGRLYPINVEVLYHTYLSGLYSSTHNRCILTNYTLTQLEYKINAFEEGTSQCMQTITPQGLFSTNGLNGYCDSPHKTHDDVMTAIYNNLVWWVKNYLTPKSTYAFNGKKMSVNKRYEVQKIGEKCSLFEKKF